MQRPGPESVSWRINQEVVVLLGWAPAILQQFAHPLVAAGVADHSDFATGPVAALERLRSTVGAMLDLTFGTGEDAARAAERINRVHDRIQGRLTTAVSVFPAGIEYSAHDPALLRWVHVTLLDTLPRAYELFVGPLGREEKDHYCREASAVGPLLGVPDGYLPTDLASLDRYLRWMRDSGQLAVGDVARGLARELLHPPFPRVAEPLGWIPRLAAVGLLPPWMRAEYGFAWGPRHAAALRLAAGLSRRLGSRFLPPLVRHFPIARRARGRAQAA